MTDREPKVLDFATAREAFARMSRRSPDGIASVGGWCDCELCRDWRLIGTTLALAEERIATLQRDVQQVEDLIVSVGTWIDSAGDPQNRDARRAMMRDDPAKAITLALWRARYRAGSDGSPQEQERT